MNDRLLITGASGHLGSYLLREALAQQRPVTAWARRPDAPLSGVDYQSVDLCDVENVVSAFEAARPDVVIHTAAVSSVGECYADPAHARHVNTAASRWLAQLANKAGARLVYVSTDMVFDGTKGAYREQDYPAPLSAYGRSKVAAEQSVLCHAQHLVLRVSLLYGPAINGRALFFDQQVEQLTQGRKCRLFHDEWRTPLSVLFAARALLHVAATDAHGLLHLGGAERLSRFEMGTQLATNLGVDAACIEAISQTELEVPEPRPRDLSLDCTLWDHTFPHLQRPAYTDGLRAMGISGG